MEEKLSKYRICEIVDGGHFFLHNMEEGGKSLALIEAKLKELKDKVCACVMPWFSMWTYDVCWFIWYGMVMCICGS